MSGLLRLSLSANPGETIDLAVPAHLAVAELLPELVLLAGGRAGARGLVAPSGRPIDPEASLAEQGIADGAVLALVEAPDPWPVEVDDPAAALAERVTEQVLPWGARLARPAGLGVGLVLFLLAGAALSRGPAWCGMVAAAVVVPTGVTAVWAGRGRDRLVCALGGWLAVGYAAVAGGLSAGPVAAGVAATLAALVIWWFLGSAGGVLAPVAGASGVLAAVATVIDVGQVDAGLAASVALAATGLVLPALPRLALALARDQEGGARDLLRASLAAVAVVVVVLAGLATTTGAGGAALAVVIALFTACRASRHHGAVEVLSGIVTATAVLVVVGAVLTVQRPEWAGVAGAALVLVAGLGAAFALRGASSGADPRWALAVDRIELALLLAVAPILVASSGVVGLVRGLVV